MKMLVITLNCFINKYRLSLHKGTKSDMRFKSSLILFYDFFRLCLFIQLYRFASVVLYRLAINF